MDREINSEITQITETLKNIFIKCADGTQAECDETFEQLEEVYDWMDKIRHVYNVRQSWAAPKDDTCQTAETSDRKNRASQYEKEIQDFSAIYKTVTDINPKMTNYSSMLEKLVEIRHNKEVSRKDFSAQIGLPERSVFRFEKGLTMPYISRFVSILHALDCELYIVQRNNEQD